MEKRKTWWVLLSVAIVNVVGGIVVQALVWIGPMFRSQSSAVGQWLLLWNMVQGLLVVVSGYLGVSAYLKEQRKATRATEVELFDHTIDAINYFTQRVLPSLNQAMTRYLELLPHSPKEKKRKYLDKAIATDRVRKADFGTAFKQLNVLSGYVHYGMVNELQLYSSISDDVMRLVSLPDYSIIVQVSSDKYLMNNYLELIQSAQQYHQQVIERRKSRK